MSDWRSRAIPADPVTAPSANDWRARAISADPARLPGAAQDVGGSAEDPGMLESFLRGGAQGATLGFADELAGGGEAAMDALGGKVDGVQGLIDAYRKHRDESRANFKAAEDANPLTSMAGNLSGGVASMFVPGLGALNGGKGAWGAIKSGAAIGGLAGLGGSNADLTEGDIGGATQDALGSAAMGAGTGLVVHAAGKLLGAGKGLANEIAENKHVDDAVRSYKFGTEGVKLTGSKALEDASSNLLEHAKTLGLSAERTRAAAGTALGAVKDRLEAEGKTINAKNVYDGLIDVVGELRKSNLDASHADADLLEGLVKNIRDGKMSNEQVTNLFKVFSPGKVTEVAAKPSTRELMEKEARLFEQNEGVLGRGGKASIVPSQDDQGNKYLSLLKTINEDVGGTERLQPVLNEAGDVVDQTLTKGDNGKISAAAKTLVDEPGIPAQRIQDPVTMTEKTVTTPVQKRVGGFGDDLPAGAAQTLKEDLSQLGKFGDASPLKTDVAKNGAASATSDLNSALGIASPDLAVANDKYYAAKTALEDLGLNEKNFRSNPITGAQEMDPVGLNKLTDTIRQSGMEGTASGVKATAKLGSVVDNLRAAGSQDIDALAPAVNKAADRFDLAQKANKAGIMNKFASPAGMLTGGSNAAGRAVRGIKANLQDFHAATPEVLKQIGSVLAEGGAASADLGRVIMQAAGKDQQGRQAILFAVQQNPAYRDMLRGVIGSSSESSESK